jgi:hypothetical protein
MKYIKLFEEFDTIEVSKSGGLNCDNPDCDWSDGTIPCSDYEKWVNKPCPECGENLLTEEDFNKTTQLMDAINVINSMTPEELEELSKNMDDNDIIEAYLKLKEFGLKHKDGDDKWTMDFKK